MSPALPESATLKSVVAALNALDARVAALEESAKLNREALRTIVTVLHPDPDHDRPEEHTRERALSQAMAVHELLMALIDKLGGRITLPPT